MFSVWYRHYDGFDYLHGDQMDFGNAKNIAMRLKSKRGTIKESYVVNNKTGGIVWKGTV